MLLFAKFNGYGSLRCAPPEACAWSGIAHFAKECLAKVGVEGVGARGGIYSATRPVDDKGPPLGIFTQGDPQRVPWCRSGCTFKMPPCTLGARKPCILDAPNSFVPRSFSVGSTPAYLSREIILAEIQESFAHWSAVLQAVGLPTIEYSESSSSADVHIIWGRPPARNGEAEFFLSGSIARTQDGTIYLNPDKSWQLRSDLEGEKMAVNGSFQLIPVVLHEIGHILGLPHSIVQGDVMFPRYQPDACQLCDNDAEALSTTLLGQSKRGLAAATKDGDETTKIVATEDGGQTPPKKLRRRVTATSVLDLS